MEDLNTIQKNTTTQSRGSTKHLSWYKDSYQSVVVQRNFFILISMLSICVIILSILVIRYIKNTKTIEPFVIEIEKKTGIPTVMDRSGIKKYSTDEVVKRALIMQYIRAREEFFFQTFNQNYSTVVKLLSSTDVYYSQYRPQFSPSNPDSPYNILGQYGTRTVRWKSIIFPDPNTAQVRIAIDTQGSQHMSSSIDKVILIGFEFQDIKLNDNERLINPLGFIVTLYKIQDENIARTSSND